MHLAEKHRANSRIVDARDLVPYVAIRVAKPAVRAQVLRIQKGKSRSVEYGCLRRIGRACGSFAAVEADLCVGAVAEGRSV